MEKIEKILKSMGLPYRYHHFEEEEAVAPPFLIYIEEQSSNFYADGITYVKNSQCSIELYTDSRDKKLEEKLEKLMKDNGLTWMAEYGYIETENMFLIRYEMEV